MIRFDRVLDSLAGFAGMISPAREELVADAVANARHRRGGRLDELAGVAAFAIRRRAIRSTGNSAALYVRQGLMFGGRALAIIGFVGLVRDVVASTASPVTALAVVATMVIAVSMIIVVSSSLLAVSAGTVLVVVAVGTSASTRAPTVSSVTALCVIATLCFALGRYPNRVPTSRLWRSSTLKVGSLAVLSLIAPGSLVHGAVLIGLATVPFALLTLAVFDARLALMTVVLWMYRFVVLDVEGWRIGAGLLENPPSDSLIVIRLMCMQVAFAASVGVSAHLVRRVRCPTT